MESRIWTPEQFCYVENQITDHNMKHMLRVTQYNVMQCYKHFIKNILKLLHLVHNTLLKYKRLISISGRAVVNYFIPFSTLSMRKSSPKFPLRKEKVCIRETLCFQVLLLNPNCCHFHTKLHVAWTLLKT